MRLKLLQAAGLAALMAVGLLGAKDFWEKPFREWKKNEVDRMLADSPWAKSQTIADQVGGRSAGIGGDKELYSIYRVRFFSALPVRQAYVRMMQMMNQYDSRSESERAEIDAKFERVLKLDFSETVIVAFQFETNDTERGRSVQRFLETSRVDLLKQSCYLINDRRKRVELQEYYPPSPDGTGAKFVFPRSFENAPTVQPADKEVKFDLYVSPLNQRVFITFKVKDMLVGGELSI